MKPGSGAWRPAGGAAGAGLLQGGAEPDAELQAGRVPGRRGAAEAAGGQPRGLGEGEEQEGEAPVTAATLGSVRRGGIDPGAHVLPPPQIDDLSREVAKLKEALNSLSQLSFSAGSPSKRQQQLQQLDGLQTQIRQLQYQLAVRPAPPPTPEPAGAGQLTGSHQYQELAF